MRKKDNSKKRTSTKVKNKYNTERPLITIRSDLPNEILKFIKELKRLNKGSEWVNEAIVEKYCNEEKARNIPKANTKINSKKEEAIKQIKYYIDRLESLSRQEKRKTGFARKLKGGIFLKKIQKDRGSS